ncbi:MAG TPA: hypothetical protein PKI19_07600 [Elusimicrobiales bacterium]|nr:hypothetical protein [Elusimicrobiales bacterium]
MLFKETFFLSLRVRILLALIAAAGAGIYLTYSAARRSVEPLAAEESGKNIYSSLKTSAAAIDAEIAAGLERARGIAASPALRELLGRRNRGADAEPDKAALRLALKEAAGAAHGLTALTLTDARGNLAAKFPAQAAGTAWPETGGAAVAAEEWYVGPPLIENNALVYEVAVAVPPSGPGLAGTLRCRFSASGLLGSRPLSAGGEQDFSLAKRRGLDLIITSKSGQRAEIGLGSNAAAPFRPAVLGKEGYEIAGGGDLIYAYSRLPAADWLIAAQVHGPAAALGYASAVLAKIRLQAWLGFALLALSAFFAVKWLAAPMEENARLAAELLRECGVPAAETARRQAETELINSALSRAVTHINQRTEHGLRLQTEAEQLREEETELKNQNLELEKLNRYLLDRETKISELKGEISELRGKITSGTTE